MNEPRPSLSAPEGWTFRLAFEFTADVADANEALATSKRVRALLAAGLIPGVTVTGMTGTQVAPPENAETEAPS